MDSPHTLKYTHVKNDQNGRGIPVCPRGHLCPVVWASGRQHAQVPPPHSHPLSLLFPRLPWNTWVSRSGPVLPALLFLPLLFHQTSLSPRFLNLIWVKLRLPPVQAPH